MSRNKGRILTVLVELEGPEADWLWDAHLEPPINGLKVLAIANGDEMTRLEEELKKAHDEIDFANEQYGIGGMK